MLDHHRRTRLDIERLCDCRVRGRGTGADARAADPDAVLLEVGERAATFGRCDVGRPRQPEIRGQVRGPQHDGLGSLRDPFPQHEVVTRSHTELAGERRTGGNRLPRQVAVEDPAGCGIGSFLGDRAQVVELVDEDVCASTCPDALIAADQPFGHQHGQRLAHDVAPDSELGSDPVFRR